MRVLLDTPTSELVTRYNSLFDQDARYGIADKALAKLFAQYPRNIRFEEILLKVVALDSLYGTNLFHTVKVAKHIYSIRPDSEIENGSLGIVDTIARIEIKGEVKRYYVFATKYCSWHMPHIYPIYDKIVDRILWAYQISDKFSSFRRSNLKNYTILLEVITQFRRYYGLDNFTYKELDKFLWYYGRSVFNIGY